MPARYETIAEMANKRGWTRGAELGVLDGSTFLHLLEYCPKLEMLIGVDAWGLPSFAEGPTKSGEKCRCEYCNATRDRRRPFTAEDHYRRVMLAARQYGARAKVIRSLTTQVAKSIPDWSLDFVFIDADHSTEGVTADIVAWEPKLVAGGFLIGHDHNMRSVRDGIDQGLRARGYHGVKVSEGDDHLWWLECLPF